LIIAFVKKSLVEYELGLTVNAAAEPETEYMSKPELEKIIREKRVDGKATKSGAITSC
jgi:excinuclease ABC subunit B